MAKDPRTNDGYKPASGNDHTKGYQPKPGGTTTGDGKVTGGYQPPKGEGAAPTNPPPKKP